MIRKLLLLLALALCVATPASAQVSYPPASAQLPSGIVFPGAPADNERFYRTDREIAYQYDSSISRWVAGGPAIPVIIKSTEASVTAAGATYMAPNPEAGRYDILLESFICHTSNAAATPASNFLVLRLRKRDGVTVTALGTGISSTGATDTMVTGVETLNEIIPSAVEVLQTFVESETGAATVLLFCGYTYRPLG